MILFLPVGISPAAKCINEQDIVDAMDDGELADHR
jgi:hypothetical protein